MSGMESADASGASSGLTFHEFLERMKQPAAADLVRRIRSFMTTFLGKESDPDADGESVQEFYRDTEASFLSHPLWKGASLEELESSGEALERYLMIKLAPKAFAAAADEAERDESLSLRIRALQHFLQPQHLDIPQHLHNDASWLLAEKELQKMASCKAPREKLRCILSCCHYVNNLLLNASISQAATTPASSHAHSGGGAGDDESVKPPGADDFLPVLIYVVIKANPPQLLSNLLYIQRYRKASRLTGEASYFYTNLVSAASFIESVTAGQLSIDPGEFERQMQEGLEKARHQPQTGNIVEDSTAPNEAQSRSDSGAESQPTGAAAAADGAGVPPREASGASGAGAPTGAPGAGGHGAPGAGGNGLSGLPGPRQVKERVVTVEALQVRPEVVTEVLRADASGELARQFRFLYMREGDVRLGDIPLLLKEYKDLALRYHSLCRAVHGAQLVVGPTGALRDAKPAATTEVAPADSAAPATSTDK